MCRFLTLDVGMPILQTESDGTLFDIHLPKSFHDCFLCPSMYQVFEEPSPCFDSPFHSFHNDPHITKFPNLWGWSFTTVPASSQVHKAIQDQVVGGDEVVSEEFISFNGETQKVLVRQPQHKLWAGGDGGVDGIRTGALLVGSIGTQNQGTQHTQH